MSILRFIKSVWSPYTDHTRIKDPSKGVVGQQRLSERERDVGILGLLDNPKPTGETIEELAKLMGQTDERKF